jgi:hypothetical protein
VLTVLPHLDLGSFESRLTLYLGTGCKPTFPANFAAATRRALSNEI